MVTICQHILRHIRVSKETFEKSQLLQADNDMSILLDQLESSAQRSLDIHAKAQALAKM
jgi:hypothetical protein